MGEKQDLSDEDKAVLYKVYSSRKNTSTTKSEQATISRLAGDVGLDMNELPTTLLNPGIFGAVINYVELAEYIIKAKRKDD